MDQPAGADPIIDVIEDYDGDDGWRLRTTNAPLGVTRWRRSSDVLRRQRMGRARYVMAPDPRDEVGTRE